MKIIIKKFITIIRKTATPLPKPSKLKKKNSTSKLKIQYATLLASPYVRETRKRILINGLRRRLQG